MVICGRGSSAGTGGADPFLYGKSASGVASTIHGLGKDGVRGLVCRFDNDVIGFSNGNTELIDTHRPDWLAVRGHDCHLQSRDPNIEVGHRGRIDKPQADLLARLEDASPIGIRCVTVDEIRIGITTDIGEIGRAHLHFSPHLAIGNSFRPALLTYIVNEITDCALMEIIITRVFLQFGKDATGVLI